MIVDMLAIVAIGPDVEVAVAHRGQVIENQVAVTPESLASPVLVLLVKALFSCFDHYQRDRHYPGQDETELGRRHKAEIRSHRGKRKDSALSAAKRLAGLPLGSGGRGFESVLQVRMMEIKYLGGQGFDKPAGLKQRLVGFQYDRHDIEGQEVER